MSQYDRGVIVAVIGTVVLLDRGSPRVVRDGEGVLMCAFVVC